MPVDATPFPSELGSRATFIGTATVLLEIGGLRILTDPVLDPAGTSFTIGKTAWVRYGSTRAPAVDAAALEPIDTVLLSHDQHRDNLDRAGFELLDRTRSILTTPAGAGRLRRYVGDRVIGLVPWQRHVLETPEGIDITITATPARHGPPLTGWLGGPVTGFLLSWPGQSRGALYLSGDTRLFRGVREVAARNAIAHAMINVGAGRFWPTLGIRYSMNGAEAARTARLLSNADIVPIHYDGWTHFSEGRDEIERAFERAGLAHRLQFLPRGVPRALTFE